MADMNGEVEWDEEEKRRNWERFNCTFVADRLARSGPAGPCTTCARAPIDRRLAGSLTVISVGVGGEEDAESGLVGDGAAAGVGTARVDAVRQHQRARLRVEHVGGARVDVA